MKFFRLLLRLWLGATFVVLSVGKIRYPLVFASALEAYRLLPATLIVPTAIVVPWLELLAGGCLVLGLFQRGASLILGVLSVTFTVMIGLTLLRGLDINCGCFTGENLARVSGAHLVFDLLLVASSAALYRWGPGPLALDRVLLGAAREANDESSRRQAANESPGSSTVC